MRNELTSLCRRESKGKEGTTEVWTVDCEVQNVEHTQAEGEKERERGRDRALTVGVASCRVGLLSPPSTPSSFAFVASFHFL